MLSYSAGNQLGAPIASAVHLDKFFKSNDYKKWDYAAKEMLDAFVGALENKASS